MAVAQLTRKRGISAATDYDWKSKYVGPGVPELKRLRVLEAENAKLKRIYADLGMPTASGHRIEWFDEVQPWAVRYANSHERYAHVIRDFELLFESKPISGVRRGGGVRIYRAPR